MEFVKGEVFNWSAYLAYKCSVRVHDRSTPDQGYLPLRLH